jgi:signal recognition particle subunit SEC65
MEGQTRESKGRRVGRHAQIIPVLHSIEDHIEKLGLSSASDMYVRGPSSASK